jgi:hypothetical protein
MSRGKRVHDVVYPFRLSGTLRARIAVAATRYKISGASLIRTGVERLLLDLAAGRAGEIRWR